MHAKIIDRPLSWPLLRVLNGRAGDVKPGMWIMAALSLTFYIFYPHL
ncbi:MAG: hypothetical protein HYS23_14270 [Geobacter sp.]|nr:hypothetical protein [Geobacter sp.]